MNNNINQENDFVNLFYLVKEFLFFLKQNKVRVLSLSIFFALSFYLLSFTQQNKYYSETLVTSQISSKTDMGIGSSSGGLSSVIGFNIGQSQSNATDFQIALELIKSRQFVLNFAEKYNLVPILFANKNFDPIENIIVFDSSKYKEETDELLIDISKSLIYSTIINSLNISKKDAFYSIGFSSISPLLSKQILDNLIYEINESIRSRNLSETQNTYEYLISKSNEMLDLSTKNIVNKLIEEQLKNMALINSSSEYVIRVVDPSYLPEFKSSPNRLYFIMFGVIFGFIFGLLVSFIASRKNNS
jgi:uncharacterized protein involved in exopolysaccharide biosynthesis